MPMFHRLLHPPKLTYMSVKLIPSIMDRGAVEDLYKMGWGDSLPCQDNAPDSKSITALSASLYRVGTYLSVGGIQGATNHPPECPSIPQLLVEDTCQSRDVDLRYTWIWPACHRSKSQISSCGIPINIPEGGATYMKSALAARVPTDPTPSHPSPSA
jgi:hypothetical protein